MDPLRRVWAILSYSCGKRLVSQMREMVDVLERWGELRVSREARTKLEAMSASTADRLLAPERKKMELKGRRGTKPGSLPRLFAFDPKNRRMHLGAPPSGGPDTEEGSTFGEIGGVVGTSNGTLICGERERRAYMLIYQPAGKPPVASD